MAKRITKKRPSKAPSARAAKIAAPDATTDPIKHIVVLMFENRSFDQMLGGLQVRYPQLDGSIPAGDLRVNEDKEGRFYQQLPLTAEMLRREIGYDPKHEHPNVMYQLYDPGRGNNQNFVRDFSWEYPGSSEIERQYIMSYYPTDSLPVLHQLAGQFTICDKWFSSVPGPTWANRLFMYGGTSQGTVRMPENDLDPILHHVRISFDMDTIFDRLSEGDIKWKVYFHDYALSSNLIPRLALQHYGNFRNFQQFEGDVSGSEDDFPGFSLIEPRYLYPHQEEDYNEPDLNYPPNDCHPPHSVFDGEHLLAKVYNALRNGPMWDSTLLVVLFDEYGGFYDHVTPPSADPPDGDTETFTYTYKDPARGEKMFTFGFNTLGCRVPALLVSPWVEKTIIHTQFEHVSVLKYVIEKFKLRGLGARIASNKTNSITSAIKTTQKPDIEAARSLRVPSHADRVPITSNQKALLAALPLHAKVGMMREHPKKAKIKHPGTV